MKKSKSLFVCALALLLSTSPVALGSGQVDPGDDYWLCPDAKIVFGGGGGGGGALPPIPADFFEPGSEPFEGQVACVGHTGDPDTTIERQTTGNTSGTPPVNDTIDIEIIALNLVSTAPITVTGGGGPQLWDVQVDLSPSGSGGTGQMELITLDQTPDSGHFLIDPLPISLRFTFTRVSDGEERTLDMGLEGLPDIEYSSITSYPWEESPIGNDFNPTGEFPMALSAGDTGYILLMPYLLRQDWFEGAMNESGDFAGGGSSGFGDGTGIGNGVDPGEWYEYPNNSPSWWNTWFYDHPFDDEREKTVNLSFFIMPYNPGFPGGSFVEIALNWSKPPWDPCQPAPPLPGDVPDPTTEDTYIGRHLVFIESYPGGIPPDGFPIALPPTVLPVTYNPEWISIDIRGWNYTIISTIFEHVCVPQVQEALSMDFGDAPDPPYPTILASNGARHVIIQGVFLGASVDAEPDGQPDPCALGDNNDGNDDEDGVTFTSLITLGDPCATVDVVASVAGKLNAWLDFNGDGDWADPCEQIFTNTVLAPGTNNLTYTVPGSATLGVTFARFRFDTNGGLSYTGQADDGEVEDYRVEIDSQQVCEPLWDGSACKPATCGQQDDVCQPVSANFDPFTGDIIVTDCNCRGEDECHVAFSHDDDWPCTEPNNGFGTIDMPPECDYTGTEPFMIIAGLPLGTTIEMDGILMNFTNIVRVPGGKLGGEVEYFDSTLDLTVRGTGELAGFNRHLAVPIECQVHTAPPDVWEPVQVFIMDMNSLTGELFGDPDFCTFRIKAGTGNGLPSPGETTLIELPGGDFAVDSFFDITYQIEFEGCPASQLEDYSGTTTATTRIETGTLPHPTCAGDCPAGWACRETTIDNPDETIDISCECEQLQCEPTPDGSSCQPADCPEQGDQCQPMCVNFDPVTGDTTVTDCDCRGLDDCYVEFSPQNDWPCTEPNNGFGTIDMPPDCDYTGTEPFMIIAGLPLGTTIEMDGILMNFTNIVRVPGGKLGGEVEYFDSTLDLTVRGTGELAGFNRHLAVPVECQVHTAPPDEWEPVQVFIMDMNSLTGELFGDPDFCTFRVKAGTGKDLPSPGQTTLLKLPSGDFAVDSFFDITYEIEFEGCPASQLEDYSGTTTATTRIDTGTLPHPACAGDCPPGTICNRTLTVNPNGTIDICCDRIPGETPQCIVPDNGTGTIDLPPEDCEYVGPDPEDIWIITGGLPMGTTIEMEGILMDWYNVTRRSGGKLAGEVQMFESTLDLDVSGTGSLAGFNRHLAVPIECQVHTAPPDVWEPVQVFIMDMNSLTGELFGDPDFCTFRIKAGTGKDLPSPGETTLVQLPSGDFAVDSFFDITYEIYFEGCPASQLEDYSGTTEESVHMSTCQQYSFDFDYNGIIDLRDFYTFAVRWLNEDIACCLADYDTDGDVDLDDLAYLGLQWLASSP